MKTRNVAAFASATALLVASLNALPATSASAVSVTVTINDISFTADHGAVSAGATVTDYLGIGGAVAIPSDVTIYGTTYDVKTIGSSAFSNGRLTSVTIPDSVTTIGAGAFEANFLATVTIPESVTAIGDYAFANNSLSTVRIPSALTAINQGAFYFNKLTVVKIPGNVISIGIDAFRENVLTSVTIPNSSTAIREGAFWQRDNATSVFFLAGPPSFPYGSSASLAFGWTAGKTVYYFPSYASAFGANWNGYPTAAITPFTTTTTPTISGTAQVGRTLTASSSWGTWSPSPTTVSYAWTRSGSSLVLGTDETYVPKAADVGSTLTVTVTAQSGGSVALVPSAATAAVVSDTFPTATPTISGVSEVGQTLTANAGTWPPKTTLSYVWKWSGTDTVVGNDKAYTPVAADLGKNLTVTVTASLPGYTTTSVTSAPTAAVALATFDSTPTPTISGVRKVGRTLTAHAGTWRDFTTFSYVWKWFGTDTVVGSGKAYTPVAADLGKNLTVTVIASLPGYTTTSVTSAPTAAVAPAASASAETWSPPEYISGNRPGNPRLTVDSTGRVTAVWSSYSYSEGGSVYASSRQNDGAWSHPLKISVGYGAIAGQEVALDSSGRVIVIWSEPIGGVFRVQSRSSLNGGAWTDPVTLSDPTQESVQPQITVSATGLATAVWESNANGTRVVQSSTSQNGGPWSAPKLVSDPTEESLQPQITVSATGLATAVWLRRNDYVPSTYSYTYVIESSTSQNGGDWTAPQLVSDPSESAGSGGPHITVSATGLATVVWRSVDGNQSVIQSSTSQNGGNWSTPEAVSDPSHVSWEPQVSVSASGLATILWIGRANDSEGGVIRVSTSQNGGRWTTPMPIGEDGYMSDEPQLTVDSTGRTIAVWTFYASENEPATIQMRTSHNGGEWSDAVTLSDASRGSRSPQIAVGLNGATTAVWADLMDFGGIGTLHSMTPFATTRVPTISGVAKVGRTLTARMTRWWTWSPTPTTVTYVWKRSDTGAVLGTDDTFVPTAAESGATLFVTATAERAGYASTEVTSAVTAAVALGTFKSPPTPTISGTAQVGQRLTANLGTWQEEATFAYAWRQVGSNTVLGTSNTYTPVAADQGKYLIVSVTASRAGYTNAVVRSDPSAAVAVGVFANPVAPTITGTAQVGKPLIAAAGSWATGATLAYSWKRPGSTSVIGSLATYTPASADIGTTLTVTVTATRAGFTTATSPGATTAVVLGLPFTSSPAPTITGIKTVGSTLTAVTTGWNPNAGVTFTYVWKRADSSSGPTTTISGAIAATYKVVAADKGKYLTVTVTAKKTGYANTTVTSASGGTLIAR